MARRITTLINRKPPPDDPSVELRTSFVYTHVLVYGQAVSFRIMIVYSLAP
jgi:hypothetical protein